MSASDANSRSFLYTGVSAGTHTITHNLNSRWVTYTAWNTVDGALITPDQVSEVTALNANQLRIILNSPEALSVRVTT